MSSTASAPTTAPATSEWEMVFQSLPTVDEGWATAKAVAEVVHLSPSTVTRRLNALEEGGRVESSTDKAVTGARGRVWRQRAGARLRVVGGIETVNLPAEDVQPDPDPVQRYVDAAELGVFDEVREVDPVGRGCGKCGEPIHPTEAEAGYTWCEKCDPDGDHSVHGPAPEMATDADLDTATLVGVGVAIGLADRLPATGMSDDEANEEFDGLPTSMIADDDGDDGPVTGCECEDCDELAEAAPKAEARPVVLVASPVPGQPPARAEVWENDPNLSVVKVVYCDSRTGARVARSRILGPAPVEPVDDEDGDPSPVSPVSPAPTGGDVAAIAEALAPAADPLTAQDARALTDRIRLQVTDLLPLIKEAYTRRAHISLGYESWAEYCDTELRGLRMPLAERQAATAELAAEGMSTRAIAGAIGSSDATVRRDLAATGATDDAPERVTGLDGRSYPARKPKTSAAAAAADGDGDGGNPSPAVPGNPLLDLRGVPFVWIATVREGIEHHRPTAIRGDVMGMTGCGRSMRTGTQLARDVAERVHDARPCPRCWPEPTAVEATEPATPGFDAAARLTRAELGTTGEAGVPLPVDGYEPDPAARIAAVADVAPEYVQPAAAALEGEVLPAPARPPQPDNAHRVAVSDGIRALGTAIDVLEQLMWDAGVGGPLTLPDLKHERRRIDKLVRRLEQLAV